MARGLTSPARLFHFRVNCFHSLLLIPREECRFLATISEIFRRPGKTRTKFSIAMAFQRMIGMFLEQQCSAITPQDELRRESLSIAER